MDKCRPKLTTILLCKIMKNNAVNLRLVFQLIIFRRQEKGENKWNLVEYQIEAAMRIYQTASRTK